MSFLGDHMLLIVLVALLLAAVLVFFLLSQRNLKASARRIKEEFGEPGDRDIAIARSMEPPPEPSPSDASDAARDILAQLDGKIAEAAQLLRASEAHTARLENAIARAQQLGVGAAPPSQPNPVRSEPPRNQP